MLGRNSIGGGHNDCIVRRVLAAAGNSPDINGEGGEREGRRKIPNLGI